jgi:hypothetical protein
MENLLMGEFASDATYAGIAYHNQPVAERIHVIAAVRSRFRSVTEQFGGSDNGGVTVVLTTFSDRHAPT